MCAILISHAHLSPMDDIDLLAEIAGHDDDLTAVNPDTTYGQTSTESASRQVLKSALAGALSA